MAVVSPVAASWRRSSPSPRHATQTFEPSSVTAYCGRKSVSPPQLANASAVGRIDVTGAGAPTRTERSLKRAPFTFASAVHVPPNGSARRARYEPRLPAGAVVTVRAVSPLRKVSTGPAPASGLPPLRTVTVAVHAVAARRPAGGAASVTARRGAAEEDAAASAARTNPARTRRRTEPVHRERL